ncbi:MAG: hypothetical protein JKY26_01715 [Pseudomonas sp.]|nr:hypothetical protein [Pseudomonas sp.]
MDTADLIFLPFTLAYAFGFCWYLVCLKKYEPEVWEEMGKPTLFNASGISSIMYVVFGDYKKSTSKPFKNACLFLRSILLIISVAALVYFLVPARVWYQ